MIGGIPYAIPWLGDFHVLKYTPVQDGLIELEPNLFLVELEDGTKKSILVKKPSSHWLTTAQKLGALVGTESVREGLFTKPVS